MSHIIINIGRQLGSGGREIGRKLANNLGCTFYDKEILDLAAQQSGFDKHFFKKNDERRTLHSALSNLRSALYMPANGYNNVYNNLFSPEGLFKFQSEAIKKAANEGPCVFVGRCADYILRDYDNVLNIFITATPEERAHHIAMEEGISKEEAQKLIREKENARASYYNYYTGKRWGDAASYDLIVNSTLLGRDKTEEFIRLFAKEYFRDIDL